MKNIVTLFAFTLLINSIFAINSSGFSIKNNKYFIKYINNKTSKEDTLTLTGVIIKEAFITKNGKPAPNVFDFFFKSGEEKYFIKATESIYSKIQLEEMMKEDNRPEAEYHSRKFKVILRNGDWDTDPKNPELQQSRIGKYIIIIQELRID